MERPVKQRTIFALPTAELAAPGRASTSNLPAYLTPLIGREQEIATVCSLLQPPEVRLLTLTGPGGVGKTRLGVQVATELFNAFSDGVCFIPLASISDPDLVLPTIARALGLSQATDQLLFELLKDYLRDEHLLLLLDNFEQVGVAAPLLVELLTTCSGLKALVTSRMVLHLQGEYDFVVPPLSLPDLTHAADIEALTQSPAVALFLQRAQAAKPDFVITTANAPLIAKTCVHLDGLPLAIELAAARIRLLSPQGLLARMEHRLTILTSGTRDAPTRQHTLRNTIEWSYHLLNAVEQRLFRRLSVFVRGCTLEAVEAVYTALGDVAGDVLDSVASLLDKSLLQRVEQGSDEPRLLLLETIREYGLECLAASGEVEDLRRVHATYYLALAKEMYLNLFGAEQGRWFARLEREYDNLRAALQWSVEQAGLEGMEMALRFCIALLQFWATRGYVSEGCRWLERALAGSEGVKPAVRARAFYAAGVLACLSANYDKAETWCQESLALSQNLGKPAGVAFALHRLGQIALARCNYPEARSFTEEALALFRAANDKWSAFGIAFSLDTLIRLAIVQGEYTRACSLAEECLVLSKEAGDRFGMAKSLFHLALLRFSEGDARVARSLAEESLLLFSEIGYWWGLTCSLGLLGLVTLQQGDEATAHSLLAQALTLRREVGDQWGIAWGLYCLGWIASSQIHDAAARTLYEKSLVILMQVDDKEFIAVCLEGLGRVVLAQGDPAWAARLWGAAEALREARGMASSSIHSPMYEQAEAAARTQLSEEGFAAAWVQGRTMTPEQVLAAQGHAGRIKRPLEGTVSTNGGTPLVVTQPPPTYPAGMTEREVEVLRLLTKGLTTAQIAEQLIISYHTANTHVRSIYNKLDVTSRTAAARYAIEHHLI